MNFIISFLELEKNITWSSLDLLCLCHSQSHIYFYVWMFDDVSWSFWPLMMLFIPPDLLNSDKWDFLIKWTASRCNKEYELLLDPG